MSKDVRKALMIAKGPVSSGYLPPGDPQRTDNLARFMKGADKRVYNKDKSPKMFYHGTTVPEDFSEFSVGSPIHAEDGSGESRRRIYTHNDPTTYLGSHFAEEPETANQFAKGLYGEAKGAQEGNRVLPVHLSIKKPHVTTETDMIRSMLRDKYDHPAVDARLKDEEEERRYDDPNEIDFRTRVNKFAWKIAADEDAYDNSSFAEKMAEQYRDRLINAGFDGIKYQNEVEGGNSWVAFHPTQIKSAVGNNGQYDPNEPEIDKAEGGVASLPVLPERPPLDVLRRMDAGAKDAWRRDRDVRLGRNYHPPGSPEHDANLMDFMEGAHPLFFKEPGVPRPVYHATNKDIRRFIPGGTAREEDMESGPATWLTFDPTNNPAAHHIGGYKGEYKEGANVMPLYANIKNPLILNDKDALKAARTKFAKNNNSFPLLLTKETKDALQEAGHDGVVFQKEAGAFDGDEILAFDNQQLKSALGNRGIYDRQDPTVDYQRGGSITKAEGGEVEETVPEAPHTLESQLQAFLQGKRKAVLYTHEEPAAPEGAQRLETAHGVFHYNPALIDERSIKAAVAGDRINEILGYGPYSKKDVLNRVSAGDTPLAVVGRDAEGREVVAAAGTHGTANEQASAIAAQLPTGGQVHIESPQQVISERIAALRSPEQGNKDARKALMIARAMGGRIGKADGGDIDGAAPVPAPAAKGPKTVFAYGRPSISETKNPKRIMFTSDAPGKVKGIVTPRHMWEGGNGKGGIHIPGMEEINEARANVYGSENRPPLTVGKLADIHQNTLAEHFQKPVQQQMADESAALGRLRAAMHIGKTANTLDESEKLDTVRHEYDDQGRTYLAYGAKGTAGHTVYTSGAGDNRKFHVVNTCAGQTGGCGGGVDKNGIVDTGKGACFAPHAEAQYVGAAVRRAAHEQAKFDPAMTQDWVLAHTGSLRAAANNSDRSNKVTLFRPNIVDETDRSTRHVIRGLNKQRIAEGKPAIIANSYGKTAELHDPENGYFVTYSNTGPKTKLGASIAENISRDKSRVHATVMANEASGKDYVNEDGNLTPPKNSYAVTDVQRGSDLDKRMQGAFTHVKYWTAGRDEKSLSPEEINEGAEGHYDGSGNPTTPVESHYGHSTLNGMRYDYQRQHILHPRLVHVGENKDGSPHMIPTDSRFKDDDYLPKDRFMTKNGKQAGAVLLTTPTTSTSSIGHQSSFTHHVDDANVSHALNNNGEYEIDPPAQQQASAGNEYEPPKGKETYARGGLVTHDENGDLLTGFPEQSFVAQRHNSHRLEDKSNNAKGEHPTQYAYGGPVEGDRQLDNSGFYNAAAEAAQGIPQAKGTPQQMMSMVQNAPGTQETMKWSGADQAFAGQPIVSKDDLVKHFQTNAPKLEETQLGSATSEYDFWGRPKDSTGTKYHKYTIPGGENYREVLLHLPPTINTEYRHKVIRADGHVDSTYDNPESSAARANEIGGTVRRDDPFTVQGGYRTLHWKDHPNVVAHLRMSDRTLPQTNEKALHLEEVQSDWGQDGKQGFKKTDEELRGLRDEMLALHKNYLDLHGSGAPPDQLQAAESKYNSAMNKMNNGFKAKTPEGPYVGNTNKWTDLALKRALIEAARGGHDKLIWTPGEEQALRYKEDDEENDAKRLKGMNKYYGEIVPSRLEKILQSIGHTPEFGTDYIQGRKDDRDLVLINRRGQYHVETEEQRDPGQRYQEEEHVAGPFATREEADAHRTTLSRGLKAVPSLKITPAMRETISKGLPRKTGGFVPPARSSAVEQALKLTSKSGATLPAAVFLARQHQSRN